MDTKLLLVKAITLLYRESQLPNIQDRSTDVVRDALIFIKPPESIVAIEFDKDAISGLRETLIWMNAQSAGTVYDRTELLQRLRVNAGQDMAMYHALEDGIREEMDLVQCLDCVRRQSNAIRIFLDQQVIKDIVKDYYMKLHFHPEQMDWSQGTEPLMQSLEKYRDIGRGERAVHPGIVSRVDLTDLESLGDCLNKAQSEMGNEGAIRFGWQGLNRMFGSTGGARRGEQAVLLALQHKFKSGTILKMFYNHAVYNKPFMLDPTRKPLLVRMSFENSATLDVVSLYKDWVEHETGLPVDIRSVTVTEAAAYIKAKMDACGYNSHLLQIDPTDFDYRDMFKIIDDYEKDGFEIHQLNMDYLAMINKKGLAQGPAGVEFRDLFRKVRNRCLRSSIFNVTPHQLSTEAKVLTRGGGDADFVNEVAEKGYYDSCRTIDQEVDIEIYQHIVKHQGEAYLTLRRGKHRKPGVISESDKFCIYKFNSSLLGNIPDDVDGPDCSRRKLGAATNAEGGELAWYDSVG